MSSITNKINVDKLSDSTLSVLDRTDRGSMGSTLLLRQMGLQNNATSSTVSDRQLTGDENRNESLTTFQGHLALTVSPC